MALQPAQIERKAMKRFFSLKDAKQYKTYQHRHQRRQMKQNLEYIPLYNRYKGWAY